MDNKEPQKGTIEELPVQPEVVHPELMNIVQRLATIQKKYGDAVEELRKEWGVLNRGCGPGAYTLSVITQEVLDLPIDASFSPDINRDDGIHIVFGLELDNGIWIDHAWTEATYKGQTLFVSHVSNKNGVEASFKVAAVNTYAIEKGYEAIGLRRIKDEEIKEVGYTEEQLSASRDIINQINSGSVPEMYLTWFQGIMLNVE